MTAKTKKLDEAGLIALIDQEARQSFGYGDGKLERDRTRNESYFLGLAKGDLAPPEIEGRSRVVDTTVRNTVLGMEAPLIKTFCGTENVFEFEENKEAAADQAQIVSDYVNYIVRKKNPGYSIISTWIREALTIRMGIVKVSWDASEIESREEYSGLTDVQLAMLLDDPEVEPIEQKAYEDEDAAKAKAKAMEQMQAQLAQLQAAAQAQPAPQNGQPPQMSPAIAQYQQLAQMYQQAQAAPIPQLYDVVCKRVKANGGKVHIENVPPEEFLISKRSKTIMTAPYCAHRVKRTISYLRSSGYTIPEDLQSDDDSANMSQERLERLDFVDSDSYINDNSDESSDPTMREVWVLESYLQADYDGDGIAEWRKVVKCGTHVLENVECDGSPFVGLGSIPLPHLLYGLCPADLAIEPQRVQTSLIRAQLDNIYLEVNGRYFAVENQVNLDDLMDVRPGGVVRVKNAEAVGRLDQGAGNQAGAMQLMEWFENFTEESTGWTRQSVGGNGMQLQQTATQTNIVTNRADSRVELISRHMAETGFTDLGNMVLKLVTKYQNKPEQVKLSGKWVNIDPREWSNQFNLCVNVGLGTGNKDQLVNHLTILGQKQETGLAIGVATKKNVYEANKKLAEALGFRNADQFFTDPDTLPPAPPPPPDPRVQVAQMKQQGDAAKMQHDAQQSEQDRQQAAQLKQYELQVESQARMEIDRNKQQAEAEQKALEANNQAQLDAQRHEYEHQREMAKLADQAAQRELERYKIDQDNATKIIVAEIQAKQKQDASLIAAESAENKEAANGS